MTVPSATGSHEKHSVFFCHRLNDARVTSLLIDLLNRHTENVSFFSSEKIEKGSWRSAIAEHLNRADFFVLVVTDSNEDWGSCLNETAYFAALSQVSETPRRKLWCLHQRSIDPPRPFHDLQSIPTNKGDVEHWLTELFDETGQAKDSLRKAIPGLADEICKLFSSNQEANLF